MRLESPETVIIQNHNWCNLMCRDCQGPKVDSRKLSLAIPEELPELLTCDELHEFVIYLKDHELLGNGKIGWIRFAGNWCEPSLDRDLPNKVKMMLSETDGTECKVGVVTNGTNIPAGEYDRKQMESYFLRTYGFAKIPDSLEVSLSIGDEHFEAFLKRKSLELNMKIGEVYDDVWTEYMQKIANFTRYAKESGIWKNIYFNIIEPSNSPPDFLDKMKYKFGIPDDFDFRYGTLRRSIYSSRQDGLEYAVDLRATGEVPNNTERCFFLKKAKGRLLIYNTIVDFCSNRGGKPYPDIFN
jgi:hypothetical protein